MHSKFFTCLMLLIASCSQQHKNHQLNDRQIVDIMLTVDQLEIAAAEVALEKRGTQPVEMLANYLMEQHHESYVKLSKLAKKLKITPEPSSVSHALMEERQTLVTHLGELHGEAFDKAYVDAMVKSHEAGLHLIDTQLLPDAKNRQLKQFVQGFRSMVHHHLEHALDVQKTL